MGAWLPGEACEYSVQKWAAQMRLLASDKDVRAGYRIAQRIAGAIAGGKGLDIEGVAKFSVGAAAPPEQTDGARRVVGGGGPAPLPDRADAKMRPAKMRAAGLPPELAGAKTRRSAKMLSAKQREKRRARWEAHVAIKFGAVEVAAAELVREDVAMATQPMVIVGAMPAPLVASLMGSASNGAMQVEASAGARPATSTLNGDAAVFVFTAGVDATSSWPSMATAAAISVAKRRAQKATARSQGVLGHPAQLAASSL